MFKAFLLAHFIEGKKNGYLINFSILTTAQFREKSIIIIFILTCQKNFHSIFQISVASENQIIIIKYKNYSFLFKSFFRKCLNLQLHTQKKSTNNVSLA